MRRFLADRDHRILLLLLVLGTIAYFSVKNADGHRGGVAELDGYYYYVYLQSLLADGDIDLDNEYRTWGNPFKLGTTPTGHRRNIFGVGPAVLWAPFFLLTHLLVLLGAKLGFPLALDGMSRVHQLGTFFGTVIYGWLAVLLCYHIAARVCGRGHALWATLGAALAGPLPFYCLTWSSYSHAQSALGTSLLVLLWLRWRDEWTPRRWLCFGAAAGLVLLVRTACFPYLLLPIFEASRVLFRALRAPRLGDAPRPPRTALLGPLLGAAAGILVFSPQLVAWKILFGELWVVPQGPGFMRWDEVVWYSTLFSPRNGLLPSAPLMTVALVGLGLAAWRQRALFLPLCGIFGAVLVVNGAVYDWWAWGFSARRFTSELPLFTLGLAAALAHARAWLARDPARSIAWVTALAVLGAILFNLRWVRLFAERNLRWYSVRSTEGLYMTVAHSMLDDLYRTVGNPLSLPAALPVALRHGASPRVFDRIDGSYLLGESHPGANPAARQDKDATLHFGDLRYRHNLSESFGNPEREGEARYAPLREPSGHVFLPLNRPGPLRIVLGARALYRGTRVEVRFNGRSLGERALGVGSWHPLFFDVPGQWVERGINRLDLEHRLPRAWSDAGPRCLRGPAPPVCLPVDVAAVSGGLKYGNFGEVWVDGRQVSHNVRGLNVAVVDPRSGRLLGAESFDVILYPGNWTELERFLDRFPRGSVVVLAMRGKAGHTYPYGGGAWVLARLGACTDLAAIGGAGYAAIGVLGAPLGTALERAHAGDHARVWLGRKPPPWRVAAHYRMLQVQ